MANYDSTDDVEGSMSMRFVHEASLIKAREYCIKHNVPIEDENRKELILIVSMASFQALPLSIRGQFKLTSNKKDLRRFNALRNQRLIDTRSQRGGQWHVSEDEDEKIIGQLIPKHFLLRI